MLNKYFCNKNIVYPSKGYNNGKAFINFLRYVCLMVYVVGFLNVFLDNSYAYNGLVDVKSFNAYSRNLTEVKSPKNEKFKKSFFKNKKKCDNENEVNNKDTNKRNTGEPKSCCSGNSESNQNENENDDATIDINYNDISIQLTKEQLFDVLNSLKKVPPKENLIHLWNHTLGVNKKVLDDLIKDLLKYFPKNSISNRFAFSDFKMTEGCYTKMWFDFMSDFGKATMNENEHTRSFYGLIERQASIDDIRNYIFSFLEEYEQKYNELYEKCKSQIFSLKKTNKK
ncbi:Plasmodium exported protein (PHISTa), unknown function [Plasmodium sp. gorilla clade G1]|nr:Plasmodium exported protein (PHISTa), unknown function [Plasmodium sp. gorilla clade G1]